ncbi:HEPN domain-containing protein [Evansella clarkii]|uniref:HEPN domain-containing protein n=1 Tax=Evansella clarkii TaxID=79879 RepID=UPI000B4534EA|nr:HEPN domain-containing protein [Evansella clarkii]
MDKRDEKLQFGNWFVGRSEFRLNGILNLNYDTNEGELELYSDEAISLPYNTDVVYGKTYQGKGFTLYKCSIQATKSTSITHDYVPKFIYKVNCSYILEGEILFTSEEEINVREVYFSVTNLNKWAFQSAVNMELDDSSEYIITTKSIDDITHQNNEFEFSIKYITMPDYNYNFTSSLKIETSTQLFIEFFKPTSLTRANSIINQVRDFISLCSDSRTYIKYVTITPFDTESKGFTPRIQVLGRGIDFEDKENVETLKNYTPYISLEQIKDDFNVCMANWFNKNEKLKPVIDLYLSLGYHRTSYERHFLNMVQALEAYHRLTRKNHVLPKAEYSKKIERIIENVDEEYQQWVKEKLAFSNEPSLHERLEELLTPTSKNGLVQHEGKYYHLFRLRNKKKDEIIRDIKNTRNYNTHFSERLLRKTVKGEELYQLILLLKNMVEFYLLTELEIDEETILDLTWEKSSRLSTRNSLLEATRDSNITF